MFTLNPTLATVGFFMEKLGNPHKKFKSIYVTGTNGKGSVCETLFAVLTNSGYKTGKFMSPVLLDLNEYIAIGDNYINSEEIDEYLVDLKPLIEEKQNEGVFVTFWEVITALSIMHFAKHKVDIAIIETGIESPVDCTNIIDPILTIITKVDVDHEALLGTTVEENMREVIKCIKPNVPVITSNNLGRGGSLPPALHLIKATAKDAKNFKTPLKGKFQKENLSLALKCFELLNQKGFNISNEQIHEGLKKIKHRARFETISKSPLVIFDGCHNANAVEAFVETLSTQEDGVICSNSLKLSIIVALLKDKDLNSFMNAFAKGIKKITKSKKVKIIFTSGTSVLQQGGSLGVFHSSNKLNEAYSKHSKNNEYNPQLIESSFEDALKNIKNNETTFIIGSFKTYKKAMEILS